MKLFSKNRFKKSVKNHSRKSDLSDRIRRATNLPAFKTTKSINSNVTAFTPFISVCNVTTLNRKISGSDLSCQDCQQAFPIVPVEHENLYLPVVIKLNILLINLLLKFRNILLKSYFFVPLIQGPLTLSVDNADSHGTIKANYVNKLLFR